MFFKPRLGEGSLIFLLLRNLHVGKFGPHPTMWVATGGQLFLVRGKGSLWSQVSHRKLKFSIWAASILGDTAKDPQLISHDYHKC